MKRMTFAGELLLPSTKIRHLVARKEPTFEAIEALAQSAAISLTATTLERLLPALLRIVELYYGRIERFGVELSPGPPECRLVLLMIRIGHDLEELGVAVDTPTVLRRTPTFTGDTARVLAVVVG